MTPGDFGDASPRSFGSGGRTVRALRSCDLTVERGEIVALAAQRVGAVMQTGGLLPDLTVAITLRTIAAAFPAPRDIDEVLDLADLTALRGRRVGKCSGGEHQRIRFALALLGSPDLLILDKPTAGMDAASRHRFWDTMAARAAEGVTVVFATHYLEEAQNFARRIVMLDRGGIIADGTLRGPRGQRPRTHLDRGERHTHRHRRGRRGVRRDGP
jgi:ABC-2 type transport system ATP-binding protein